MLVCWRAENWTRLSCHDFVGNQVRLQLFALAYNLGNFLRRLALPERIKRQYPESRAVSKGCNLCQPHRRYDILSGNFALGVCDAARSRISST